MVQTDFEEHGGQFSPDGKWIAYVSIKSGRYEVYVRPFAQRTGDEIRISTDGGDQVRWRPDGKELFYIARDGQLVAVPIRPGSNSETVETGTPVRLFVTRVGGWAAGLPVRNMLSPPDGHAVPDEYAYRRGHDLTDHGDFELEAPAVEPMTARGQKGRRCLCLSFGLNIRPQPARGVKGPRADEMRG